MDLIYSDNQLKDLGVLQDYSFDMEYGKDSTNDFQCRVQSYNHVCDQDYILYVEFTEYGGVIDRIESDTKSGEVTYIGRTWHGLLNSFVIEPADGEIYRTFDGDANEVLAEIVALCGMTTLFEVDSSISGVTISEFNSRYEKAYDLILRMMDEYNAKMYCFWKSGKVHIGAMLSMNYAVSEEFDSSQVPFKVGYTYNNINHMVCLGRGEGADRAVIHLFCDEGGGVQPYTLVENPLQDSDYILDKSQQVLTGREERSEIYDFSSAEIITNYIALTTKPSDWNGSYYKQYYTAQVKSGGALEYNLIERVYEDEYHLQNKKPNDWNVQNNYQKYYYWDANADEFKKVEALPEEQASIRYTVLTTKPKDWKKHFDVYFELDSSTTPPSYKSVSPYSEDIYTNVTKKPKDWTWHYGSYYTRSWDGSEWQYSAIDGIDHYNYKKHTKKPTDWNSNWGNYYTKLKAGEYTSGSKIVKYKAGYYTVNYAVNTAKVIALQAGQTYPKWSKGKFYNQITTETAPKFSGISGGIYKKVSEDKTPTFVANRYYMRYIDDAPTWVKGTYYTKYSDVEQIPKFKAGQYFYAVEDRMKMLVDSALEKLAELRDTSTLDIDLELDSNYDVGDVIGSIDNVTGIEVNKPILRKIIKIRKDLVTVEHEVD